MSLRPQERHLMVDSKIVKLQITKREMRISFNVEIKNFWNQSQKFDIEYKIVWHGNKWVKIRPQFQLKSRLIFSKNKD